MIHSVWRLRFESPPIASVLLALSLCCAHFVAAPTAAYAQSPQATRTPPQPPDPPVLPPGRSWTPASYQSNTGSFVDDDGDRQGTLIMREWWYSYNDFDRVIVVGTGELTITPTSQPLTRFDFTLRKGEPGCTPYTHDPDTNNSPLSYRVQGQGGVSGGKGTGSVAVGIGGVLREDKVTIEDLKHEPTQAEWKANVGGGRERSGVNGLVFLARWSCPPGVDLSSIYHSGGRGHVEIDDYGPNTTYWFDEAGVGGRGESDCHRWIIDPQSKQWVCTDHRPDGRFVDEDGMKNAPQSGSSDQVVPDERAKPARQIGQAQPGREAKDERSMQMRASPVESSQVVQLPASETEMVREVRAPAKAERAVPVVPAIEQLSPAETRNAGNPQAKPAAKTRVCGEGRKGEKRCETTAPPTEKEK